ncbi:hypothetical protein DKT74_31195, partial [Streptomyces sp. ZEA17I]|uniref:hypothetical protein n=1 Tax=Streptomyces sp. ZEA17I TaxID=2202516 RepID=UPI000D90BEED
VNPRERARRAEAEPELRAERAQHLAREVIARGMQDAGRLTGPCLGAAAPHARRRHGEGGRRVPRE